ncbi:MarR family transcriptional regulator [Microcella daejeonensis]|jgi:DNA-binding MarR family transcriptional regulator|uniref:MarR family transcriptional regulator n=1 Tax=Microcella daejeonensis TaxID=2994971 RepID=A0A9E8MP43_9MICO|nr:MarR family transcriptional regulator [Microcella daejeonensis]WAB82502.1 MarR family transcriptional regulator [Microcella daejeonensis]WAB84672.1 MarR family transcriptional regulator [Microcella daejeonensis]
MSSATDPHEELRVLIQKVARRIRAERGGEGVTDSQLGVLWRLASDGRCTPGGLADSERVSPPSMNRTVNALEALGYVRREPSETDARQVWVTLTPAGDELIAETRRLRNAWFHEQLDALEPAERAALEAAMDALRKLADS